TSARSTWNFATTCRRPTSGRSSGANCAIRGRRRRLERVALALQGSVFRSWGPGLAPPPCLVAQCRHGLYDFGSGEVGSLEVNRQLPFRSQRPRKEISKVEPGRMTGAFSVADESVAKSGFHGARVDWHDLDAEVLDESVECLGAFVAGAGHHQDGQFRERARAHEQAIAAGEGIQKDRPGRLALEDREDDR